MNFNRVSKKVTNSFIVDPYASLMHYRRSFKFLKLLKENGSPILAIGNKNKGGFDWKNNFDGINHASSSSSGGPMSETVLAAASKHYHLILCFDPVLYCSSLQNLNLPVMSVATSAEISEYPEILKVTDYLLPAPTGRADAALRQIVFGEVFGNRDTEKQ